MSFKESYLRILSENGLTQYATEDLALRFEELTDRLLDYNAKVNLTAITDPEQIILRHYADCLMAADSFPQNATVLDVGCGGGFPCLPLAIARPDLTVTGLDSTEKKLRFVQSTADAMGLSLTTVAGRAEELSHGEMRQSFDVVTARAVAAMNVLAEWCLPFVKTGGLFIALKGSSGAEELAVAKKGISVLGAGKPTLREYTLSDMGRSLITVPKVANTPIQYPRPNGKIMKKPL